MTVEPGYPITLVHPQHRPATIATGNMLSSPEQFPNVTVNGTQHEAEYRAKGYLRFGEPQAIMKDHHEYPKMMRHAEYVAEVPARIEAKIEDGRITGTFVVPAKPAKFPDVTVNNEKEEEVWSEKGYKPAGEYKRDALEAVLNGTIDEEEYNPDEYPKWEKDSEGKPKLIARDPNKPDLTPTPDYPRWEDGVLVHDPRFPQAPDPSKYPMWVHKDGKPGKDSVLVKTPTEEFAVRAKWAPVDEEKEEENAKVAEAEVVEAQPSKRQAKVS